MWYRRLVSWIRSLFGLSQPSQPPAPVIPPRPRTQTLPMTSPLRPPQSPLDEVTPPRPQIEFPMRREPPTTVPLARLTTNSQPISGLPATGEGLSALSAFWAERDAGVPTQPPAPPPPASQPASSPLSQPLDTDFEQFEPELPEPELPGPIYPAFDVDETAEEDDLTPGSMLYRRLMILRRLVRQGVYNEGFQPDALPEQYQRYGDADGGDTPFYGE